MDAVNSKPDDAHIRELHRRASKVRRRLVRNVDGLKERAEEWLDWKYYVRRYPWTVMSTAFAVGLLLAPRRKPRPPELERLPDRRPEPPSVTADSQPSMLASVGGSLLHAAAGLAGQMIISSAIQYVGNQRKPAPEDQHENLSANHGSGS